MNEKENRKILISDFVKKYNNMNTKLKGDFIRSIVTRRYCPITLKRALLQNMLDRSIAANEHGIEYIDMYTHRLNTIGFIVGMYTNLEYESDEEGNKIVADGYDILTESGVLDKIIEEIGEREMTEIETVEKTLMDSWYNQHNAETYIASQITRLGEVIGSFAYTLLNEMDNLASDDSKIKNIMSKIV